MRVVELCFMLTYSEAIFAQIKAQYKTQIRTALDECWSFLENKNKSGKDLYILLDDGTDFNGIFIYMQLDNDESNIPLWDNISYAIAATAKEAYLFEQQTQLPSALENIDSNLLDIFIENLEEINSNLYKYVGEIKEFAGNNHSFLKIAALNELGKLGLIEL
jgi:hypothetical protein